MDPKIRIRSIFDGEVVGSIWPDTGVIRCVELETRRDIFLRQDKIAGVMAYNGAARILFDRGGHVDVCGAAEIWWREIELARLESGGK